MLGVARLSNEKPRKYLVRGVMFVAAIASLMWIVGPSKSFQQCVKDRKADQHYQTLHEPSGVLVRAVTRLHLNIGCGFVASNENTGAITALAGVAVAFFTFTLWLSTHRLWQASERQIVLVRRQTAMSRRQMAIARQQAAISKRQVEIQQAVADLERPTLFVTSLGSVEFEPWKYPSDGTEQCRPVVQMRFANFGRTPAVLLAIEGEVFMTRKGSPPPPGWTKTTHLPTHSRRFQIMATGEDKGATVEIAGHPIPAGHAGAYQGKQLGVFVWGRFVYVDPFGAQLETRYALVPGKDGEPMPGNYPGHNEIRTYTRDDPDAPHARYGA